MAQTGVGGMEDQAVVFHVGSNPCGRAPHAPLTTSRFTTSHTAIQQELQRQDCAILHCTAGVGVVLGQLRRCWRRVRRVVSTLLLRFVHGCVLLFRTRAVRIM